MLVYNNKNLLLRDNCLACDVYCNNNLIAMMVFLHFILKIKKKMRKTERVL